MEEYSFNLNRFTIKYGKFKDRIYGTHLNKYGKNSADKILEKSTCILKEAILQKNDSSINNNSLIIGKVQSGKTSNLEMISALAFDNGYNMLIVYGGYDNTLLDQSKKRFSKVFDPAGENEEVKIVSTIDGTVSVVENTFVNDCIKDNIPIIIISLKRPSGLSTINSLLSKIDTGKIKSIIIDDEGDQASLNVAKDKNNDASSTYANIREMKKILNDPIYFSVTATPMANVFLPDFSVLRPGSLHLVYPASGYTGAGAFHLLEDRIEDVPQNDINTLENGRVPDSLTKALRHFILASAILSKEGCKKSTMIIHSFREVAEHENMYEMVCKFFEVEIFNIENDYEEITYDALRKVYNELFDDNIRTRYTIEDLKQEIIHIINSTKVIKRNSSNRAEEENIKFYKYSIHIGGDLLQRGVTFDNLVTTYFTRWSENGNMDTNLQRARWFGYRSDYLRLCKVFLPRNVKMEFANLASIENDLWDQFEQIETGEMTLDDIVIDAEDTSLRPTRRNAVNYKKVKFTKKWFNQRIGVFDPEQISINTKLFDQLIENKSTKTTCAGRTDGKESARYIKISKNEFINFIKKIDFIFNLDPFSINDIVYALKDEEYINIVLMYGGCRKESRVRSFANAHVSALQQGADALDPNEVNYKGDSYVIPEYKIATMQVFKIVPKINGDIQPDFMQYMFSIHVPKKRIGYTRGL